MTTSSTGIKAADLLNFLTRHQPRMFWECSRDVLTTLARLRDDNGQHLMLHHVPPVNSSMPEGTLLGVPLHVQPGIRQLALCTRTEDGFSERYEYEFCECKTYTAPATPEAQRDELRAPTAPPPQPAAPPARPGHIDIVFDGPPSPTGATFVEVENDQGESITFGYWLKRDDGFWVLRIPGATDLRASLVDAELEIDRLENILAQLKAVLGAPE